MATLFKNLWLSEPSRCTPALMKWLVLTASDQAFLRGTLAPFFRASESPMAIACFRLFTRPPFPAFPERSVPRFLRRIALATVLLALLPYRRPELLRELPPLLAAM